MERQALQAERKKAAEAAAASASAGEQPATLAALPGTETPPTELDADTRATEAPEVTPVAESVPRSEEEAAQPALEATNGDSTEAAIKSSQAPSHDQQQPV